MKRLNGASDRARSNVKLHRDRICDRFYCRFYRRKVANWSSCNGRISRSNVTHFDVDRSNKCDKRQLLRQFSNLNKIEANSIHRRSFIISILIFFSPRYLICRFLNSFTFSIIVLSFLSLSFLQDFSVFFVSSLFSVFFVFSVLSVFSVFSVFSCSEATWTGWNFQTNRKTQNGGSCTDELLI